MANRNYIVQRRNALLAKHPYCHWCGRKVRNYVWLDKPALDAATIDHLMPRNETYRVDTYKTQRTLVLACWGCNAKRNMESQAKMSRLQKWILAGNRFPRRWTLLKWFLLLFKLI